MWACRIHVCVVKNSCNKIHSLALGLVRLSVVFMNQQKAGEGAGSPLSAD